METYIIIAILLITHFIADFVLQEDRVAKGKSKSNWILAEHVTIYMLPFIFIVSPLYALINGILHFAIDYFTSRLTGKLWAEGRVHDFFVVIGFDQLLHALSLIGTYYLMFEGV